MSDRPVVLVAEDDAELRRVFLRLLGERGDWRVIDAADGLEALAIARSQLPDLVIADYMMPGLDGIALCRAIKATPALEGTMVMVLSGVARTEDRVAGLQQGVDAFATKPVDASELLALARALMRVKTAHDALRRETAARLDAAAALERGFDQLLHLLVHLLDLARPGAEERGRRLAEAAMSLGERCEVPPVFRRELELAALLWEIGDLGATRTSSQELAHDEPPWRRAVIAREVLADVERLRPVAELVNCIYEHWDGTGWPGHMQRGQIPFRSRLLRVLIDWFALRDQGLTAEAAHEKLMEHSGTHYDPALLVVLGGWLQGAAPASHLRQFVPVDELQVGMVLADDLCTSSGVLLLTSGTTITAGSLPFIQRRHASDPILTGPYVRPAS